VVRADASYTLGSGHIMRCLTLIDQLVEQGAAATFVCQQLPGELSQAITDRGHRCSLIPLCIDPSTSPEQPADLPSLQRDATSTRAVIGDTTADWLVVDHYQLQRDWHRQLRPHCRRILVIDDLANRCHDCDLLHDQTLGRESADYQCLVGDHCELLLGTRFALLRPQFSALRKHTSEPLLRHGPIKHLLIGLGGSDTRNIAFELLKRLETRLVQQGISVMLVAGAQYQHVATVASWAEHSALSVEIYHNVSEVAPLLLKADIAIGAAGSSAWERCCLGLPTLAVVYAENQSEIAEKLQRAGAVAIWRTVDELHNKLDYLLHNSDKLSKMSQAAAALCDGIGTRRVVDAMARLHD